MTFPAPRWVWYGGRRSLDFVNTCRNREAGRADEVAEYLRGPDDFMAWLSAAGLGPAGPGPASPGRATRGGAGQGGASAGEADPADVSPAAAAEAFAAALDLREAISALVTATVGEDTAPAAAVRCVNTWLALPPQRPVLHLEAGVTVLGPAPAARTPRDVLAMIAADAAELLGTDLRQRLRICPGPGCRGRPGRLARRTAALVLDGRVRQPEQGRDAPAGRPRGGRPTLSGRSRAGIHVPSASTSRRASGHPDWISRSRRVP